MQHRLYYVIIMETTCTCHPGFTGLPELLGRDLTAPPAEPAAWVQGLSPSPCPTHPHPPPPTLPPAGLPTSPRTSFLTPIPHPPTILHRPSRTPKTP